MNGVVLLIGGLLLLTVIKLIMERNWIGLLFCAVALFLVFGTGHHAKQGILRIEEVKYAEFNKYADTGIAPVSLGAD